MIYAWLTTRAFGLAKGWWLLIGLAVLIAGAALKAAYDASVIRDHEDQRTIKSIDALDNAAEQRAANAIQGIIADRERTDVIDRAAASEAAKPPEARATLPPTTRALNCKRMEQAYSAKELARIEDYQENCR